MSAFETLSNFHNVLEGRKWINKENWLSNNPIKTWYGVDEDSGNVIQLILKQNELNGIYSLLFICYVSYERY
jgi:hypothetical protein